MDGNVILTTDSYKVGHYAQYPPKTETVYSYLESRGGEFQEVCFFGLQAIINEWMLNPITAQDIEDAKLIFAEHLGEGNLFNEEGWKHILEKHNGYIPVKIYALPEGTVTKPGTPLVTVENTDPEVPWVTNYIETFLSQVWYPTTVATLSRDIKKLIKLYMEETCDNLDKLDFMLHDFGFRGSTSVESASIGGTAHLVNFKGTDTLQALVYANRVYGADKKKFNCYGYSIFASEHSTITSWGKDREVDAFKNMLDQHPNGFVACVSDSFDVFNACENLWGNELKEQVLNRDGTLVIRLDSGDPAKTVIKCLEILGKAFGTSINGKGYKLLPPQVRVIQGDGVNRLSINEILFTMKEAGWSTDNICFGMGGALIQKVNRDTCSFAFKCSSVTIDGVEQDVWKDPVTDKAKASKRGKFAVTRDDVTGKFQVINKKDKCENCVDHLLCVYYKDEKNEKPIITNKYNMEGIRMRANV